MPCPVPGRGLDNCCGTTIVKQGCSACSGTDGVGRAAGIRILDFRTAAGIDGSRVRLKIGRRDSEIGSEEPEELVQLVRQKSALSGKNRGKKSALSPRVSAAREADCAAGGRAAGRSRCAAGRLVRPGPAGDDRRRQVQNPKC